MTVPQERPASSKARVWAELHRLVLADHFLAFTSIARTLVCHRRLAR
ncbi:hypothetical protein [Streptomyces sp. NPDC096012]